jgi:hypothetical protein
MLVAWCFDRYFSLLLGLHAQRSTMIWTCLLDSAHVRLLYTSGTCLYTSLACNSCFTRCKLAKSWSCRSDLLFSCNCWLVLEIELCCFCQSFFPWDLSCFYYLTRLILWKMSLDLFMPCQWYSVFLGTWPVVLSAGSCEIPLRAHLMRRRL